MDDYSDWKTQSMGVTNLRIDPYNPRIPPSPKRLSQPELIHLFARQYDVYDLAKGIARDGFFPDERIVIVKEGKDYTVLEGNRRIAALKMLIQPELAPAEKKKSFKKISKDIDNKMISNVETLIAPTRESALKMVLEKHTGTSVLRWTRIMQCEFYRKLEKAGLSAEEISKKYSIPPSTVNELLQAAQFYNLAASMDLKENIKEKVLNPKFSISTVERIINNDDTRKQLRISDDLYSIECKPAEFKKAFTKVITDVATGKENSRTLNEKKDIKRYANELKKHIDPKKTRKKTSLESLIQDDRKQNFTQKRKKKGATQGRSVNAPTGLFRASAVPFKIEGAESLKRFWKETRELPVKTKPNATAIMMRVLLEKSCRHFLKRKGIKSIQVGKDTKNLAKVTLGEILDYLTKRKTVLIDDENIKKATRHFKNSAEFKSLSSLNTIVHNEEVCFTEKQVRDLWPTIEGLMKLLLSE